MFSVPTSHHLVILIFLFGVCGRKKVREIESSQCDEVNSVTEFLSSLWVHSGRGMNHGTSYCFNTSLFFQFLKNVCWHKSSH